jgi:hypothetical protein
VSRGQGGVGVVHGLPLARRGGGGASAHAVQRFGLGWLSEGVWKRKRREWSRDGVRPCSTCTDRDEWLRRGRE